MKLTELFLEEIERESERTARVLEQAPAQKTDWTPHERSMAFGPLSQMVAVMPSWVAMMITMNELDIAPVDGPQYRPPPMDTPEALLAGHQGAMTQVREALNGTDDDFLSTPWRLLAAGKVVAEQPRRVMIRDTINHWAHHRGQMTVYLRLMGAKVPALYGPSADDARFA